MRLKTSAGLSAPLLLSSFAAILAGCPTGTAQKDNPNPPAVTAVYAVDLNASLSDVALYLANDPFSKSSPRVSAKAPASYGAFRVEVDQALDGTTIGPLESLNNAPGSGGTALHPDFTACVQSKNVTFTDVTAGKDIPSSVCYNPSTTIGSNPHIDIQPGASTDATAVFTCQAFNGAGALAPGNTYAIKLNANAIKGSNGKSLTTPTGGNSGAGTWANGTFTFQTSDLEVMAANYNDPSTGYFHILSKPTKGYLKDLDPEDPSTFRMLPTSDAFMIFLSDSASDPNTGGITTGDGNAAATVTRTADGSVFPATVDLDSNVQYFTGDPRIIDIVPAGTWEPNVKYTVTLNPTIKSGDSGNALGGTAQTFTFTAADAPLAVIAEAPKASATGVSQTSGCCQLEYQAPIDPATVTTDNVKLTQGSTAIAVKLTPPAADSNFQVIGITPVDGTGAPIRLLPSTPYTLTANNLKTHPTDPVELKGKAFSPFTNTFTTISFQTSRIAASPTSTTNIDRSLAQSPTLVVNGGLSAVFNNAASNVSATTLHLGELAANGTVTDLGATVTQKSPTTFTLQAPANYVVKCGQKYQVKADTAITDPNNIALHQEGCVASSCPDTRTFGTAAMNATIGSISAGSGTFKVSFTYPADPASVNPQLPTTGNDKAGAIKMYLSNADGSLTQVGLNCTLSATATSVSCSPTSALTPNAAYVINVIFTKDNPLKVAPTLTSGGVAYNVDPTSCQFNGIKNSSFTTACAP